MKAVPVESLSLAVFEPLLNSRFVVMREAAPPVELVLIETKLLGPRSHEAWETTGFSLLFHGPDTAFLPQRMYCFEQETIGRFDMFIVPIGRAKGMFQYQAVFNRAN